MIRIPILHAGIREAFPPPESALDEPNGLLAAGGDLSPQRLLDAYRHGIFPWYSDDAPILWWSPDPRMVLFPGELRVSRSLRKTLERDAYETRFDSAFAEVIARCAAPRDGQSGTWIVSEMAAAYTRLHELGFAHSVESWRDGELVGGLYGVALGRVFFGESMFSRETDASKVALVRLVERLRRDDYRLIDCQQATPHLASLGAREISRNDFANRVQESIQYPASGTRWT
jgi:leucyl/phenylalanyl-tRNA--protein transferase